MTNTYTSCLLLASLAFFGCSESSSTHAAPELARARAEGGQKLYRIPIKITSDHGFVLNTERLGGKEIKLPIGVSARLEFIYAEDKEFDGEDGHTHQFVLQSKTTPFRSETGPLSAKNTHEAIEFTVGLDGTQEYILACSISCHRMDNLFMTIRVVAKDNKSRDA